MSSHVFSAIHIALLKCQTHSLTAHGKYTSYHSVFFLILELQYYLLILKYASPSGLAV